MAEKRSGNDSEDTEFECHQNQDTIELSINTDDRKQYDWESKYPLSARSEMRMEAVYIGAIFLLSLILLLCIWCGLINELGNRIGINPKIITSVKGIIVYFLSGLLGGTIFGIKYFYRVVARGYWSQDRKYWRIFSPWISACISFIVGCMIFSGYLNSTQTPSIAAEVCVGFIAGYFADDAVGKMSEVATALFGSSIKVDSNSNKK